LPANLQGTHFRATATPKGHLEEQIEENIARGMNRDEAARMAVSTFGGGERVRARRASTRRCDSINA
jgi:hypothetical protein